MAEKPGEIESIGIEAAENGYMVMCRMCPPKPKKGEPNEYTEPERYVYETPEAVLAKVGALLSSVKKPRRAGKAMSGVGMSII